MSKGMFPKPFWLWWFGPWKPVMRGSDEFGRHTICIGIPWLVHLVIPWRICPVTGDCADMAEFRCVFPCCPYMAVGTGGTCMTHDEEFWQEIDDEGAV